MNKHNNMEQQKAAALRFSKLSKFLKNSIYWDTEDWLNSGSERKQYFYVNVDFFSKCFAAVSSLRKKVCYDLNSFFTAGYQKLLLFCI